MLILLPPSESKSAPATGDPVSFDTLSFPSLTKDREHVVTTLARVSGQKNALTVLGVGESLAADVARNRELRTAPSGPALSVYTGVLYDALDAGSLSGAAREIADRSLVVMSALWGAVRPTDLIPAYRLSMGTALPRYGKLNTWWKPRLTPALDELAVDQVIVDCRSAAYAAAWKAPAAHTIAVRVEQLDNAGKRSVVSHNAKHTRGLVARFLCEFEAEHGAIDTVDGVREALGTRWTVELVEPTARKAGTLTVVLDPPAP